MSTIPLCDIVVNSREKATLKHTKECACRHETCIVLDESLAYHRSGPHHHDECQPNAWPEAFHHYITGYFRRNVEGKEDGEAIVVL